MDLLAGLSLLFSAISPSHILSSFQQTINEAQQWAKLLNPIFVSLHLGIFTSSSPMTKWASLKFPNRSLPREMFGKPSAYFLLLQAREPQNRPLGSVPPAPPGTPPSHLHPPPHKPTDPFPCKVLGGLLEEHKLAPSLLWKSLGVDSTQKNNSFFTQYIVI